MTMSHTLKFAQVFVLIAMAAIGITGPATSNASAQSSSRETSSREDSSTRGEGREEGRRRWGERFGRRDRDDNDRDRDRDRDRDEESSSGGGSRSSPNSTTASRPASTSSDGGSNIGLESYAKSLVQKYDKNSNMMLEANERAELKGEAAKSDTNNDGVITVTELVAHLSSGSSAAAKPTGGTPSGVTTSSTDTSRQANSRSDGGGSDTRSGDKGPRRVYTALPTKLNEVADKRHSSRFISPAERLPTGLPPFFKSSDKNGDGQVSMSEYSRTWTKSKVDEFLRYDRNKDGMITAKEVAK
jgi:Ca2+-binding EF-hand superfamily protein